MVIDDDLGLCWPAKTLESNIRGYYTKFLWNTIEQWKGKRADSQFSINSKRFNCSVIHNKSLLKYLEDTFSYSGIVNPISIRPKWENTKSMGFNLLLKFLASLVRRKTSLENRVWKQRHHQKNSKQRGGWLTEGPEDLLKSKSKRKFCRSPSTQILQGFEDFYCNIWWSDVKCSIFHENLYELFRYFRLSTF